MDSFQEKIRDKIKILIETMDSTKIKNFMSQGYHIKIHFGPSVKRDKYIADFRLYDPKISGEFYYITKFQAVGYLTSEQKKALEALDHVNKLSDKTHFGRFLDNKKVLDKLVIDNPLYANIVDAKKNMKGLDY